MQVSLAATHLPFVPDAWPGVKADHRSLCSACSALLVQHLVSPLYTPAGGRCAHAPVLHDCQRAEACVPLPKGYNVSLASFEAEAVQVQADSASS